MPVSFRTVKRISRGNVFASDIAALDVDSLDEALQQAGFKHNNHIGTKRGAWEIFLRRNYHFTTFLPSQNGNFANRAAAVYHDPGSFGDYAFMTQPEAHLDLEEMASNAQHISSGIIESLPLRFFGWMTDENRSSFIRDGKVPLYLGGSLLAGFLASTGIAAVTGNSNTAAGYFMMLEGTFIGGFATAGAGLTTPFLSYLFTSAKVSNAGNYAFGKEVTAALDANLALLQTHKVAEKAYSALASSGLQMGRENFWEIMTGLQKAKFSLHEIDDKLSSQPGFVQALNVIKPYSHELLSA